MSYGNQWAFEPDYDQPHYNNRQALPSWANCENCRQRCIKVPVSNRCEDWAEHPQFETFLDTARRERYNDVTRTKFNNRGKKLSQAAVEHIQYLHGNDWSIPEIARELDLSIPMISKALRTDA